MDMETLRNRSSEASARISGNPPPAAAPKADPTPAAAPTTPDAPKSEPAPDAPKAAASETAPKAPKSTKKADKTANAAAAAAGVPTTPDAPIADAAIVEEGKAAAAAAGVPYTPNLKYKVADQEKEIPEMFRSLVKDAESEKTVREILEKSDGLPLVKQRLADTSTKYKELQVQHQEVNAGLKELGDLVKKKDFGTFFDTLKIPRQELFQWALREAEISQMDPEQRAHIENERAAQKQAEEAQRNSQTAEQRFYEQAVRTRQLEMKMVLNQPEVSSFASRFNEVQGNAHAFEMEVVKTGRELWANEQVDASPEELAQMVMEKYSRFMGQPQSNAAPVAPAAPTNGYANPNATPVVPNTPPPTLPNLQGGTTSPTKAAPKTLADLKKLSHEASARMARRN